ncbi:MAG: hypothetical protein ACI4MQ_01720 [Candidatus Coproplasma sp.]
MDEKVKVTLDFNGELVTDINKVVAVVSLNRNIIAGNCNGIDLLKLAAQLDIALDTTVKMLSEDYAMSHEEILINIAGFKKLLKKVKE